MRLYRNLHVVADSSYETAKEYTSKLDELLLAITKVENDITVYENKLEDKEISDEKKIEDKVIYFIICFKIYP